MATKSPRSRPYGGTRGKPQQFSVDEVEYTLRTSLGNVTLAASMLGCAPSTVYDYLHRFPERLAGIRRESRREIADIGEGQLLLALRRGAIWATREVLRLYGSYIDIGESLDITSNGEPLVAQPAVIFNVELVQSRFKCTRAAEQREADTILIERKIDGRFQ